MTTASMDRVRQSLLVSFRAMPIWHQVVYAVGGIVSVALLIAAWQPWVALPLDKTEVLAFVTGAWSVWLAARGNIWNWPIGIANSIFFVFLFYDAHLFFDMGINVFYVLSGFYGWWLWAFGGRNRTERPVGRTSRREGALLAVALLGLTLLMWNRGVAIQDAAPFPDALTTALSIVAQWLLMKRQIENWSIWISADVIYIGLYAYKNLYLTAVLYLLFLVMCLVGWRDWRRGLATPSGVPEANRV